MALVNVVSPPYEPFTVWVSAVYVASVFDARFIAGKRYCALASLSSGVAVARTVDCTTDGNLQFSAIGGNPFEAGFATIIPIP